MPEGSTHAEVEPKKKKKNVAPVFVRLRKRNGNLSVQLPPHRLNPLGLLGEPYVCGLYEWTMHNPTMEKIVT